jgi:hypothetical protein
VVSQALNMNCSLTCPVVTGGRAADRRRLSYSWITALDWANNSWTAPMDARRIRPTQDATDLTISQVADLVARLGNTAVAPVLCFDAGYDPIALTDGLTDVPANIVVADPRRPGFLHRPHPTGCRHARAPSPPRPAVRLRPARHLARPRPGDDDHRQSLRHRARSRTARTAPATRSPWTLGPTTTSHRSWPAA